MGAIVQIQHLLVEGEEGKKSFRQSSLQFQEEEGICIWLGSVCASVQLGSLGLQVWLDEELYRACRISRPPHPITKLHACNHSQKTRDNHNPHLRAGVRAGFSPSPTTSKPLICVLADLS